MEYQHAVNQHAVAKLCAPALENSAQSVIAVVLAAGFGTRFDPHNPKQLISLAGKPIVCWSIEAFEHNASITDIVVVVNARVRSRVEALIAEHHYAKIRCVIEGGAERVDSTQEALEALTRCHAAPEAYVLIHDAVRPFVEQSAIDGCIEALHEYRAATVACLSTDTVVLTEDMGDRKVVAAVPERRNVFRAQTPQAFHFATIQRAYELADADPDFHPTDDTRAVVEYLPQEPVAIVAGSDTNMKITTQSDLPAAELLARQLSQRS